MLHPMRVRSADELDSYLTSHRPDSVEVELHEADVSEWGLAPEMYVLSMARQHGYEIDPDSGARVARDPTSGGWVPAPAMSSSPWSCKLLSWS